MWLTVVPIEPPVRAGADVAQLAAERVDVEFLLRGHVRRVQVVMAVDDRPLVLAEHLRMRRRRNGERQRHNDNANQFHHKSPLLLFLAAGPQPRRELTLMPRRARHGRRR